jgi:hypothetical protein
MTHERSCRRFPAVVPLAQRKQESGMGSDGAFPIAGYLRDKDEVGVLRSPLYPIAHPNRGTIDILGLVGGLIPNRHLRRAPRDIS